jgi:chromatin remodeling complex protein RSC6
LYSFETYNLLGEGESDIVKEIYEYITKFLSNATLNKKLVLFSTVSHHGLYTYKECSQVPSCKNKCATTDIVGMENVISDSTVALGR